MIYRPSEIESLIIYARKQSERMKWLKIEPIPETKTINQNNYIWLVFTVIADDTGNTPQDIYEYYLEKYPLYKEITVSGNPANIRLSLSKLDKDQTSWFIDRIVTDARSEGYVIPDPGDKAAIDQFNFYKQRGLI